MVPPKIDRETPLFKNEMYRYVLREVPLGSL